MSLDVVALSAGANTPSSRFRIREYIPVLGAFGINVKDYPTAVSQQFQLPPPFDRIRRRYYLPLTLGQAVINLGTRLPGTLASYRADVTWISRSYLPGMESLVRLVNGPRILDVDDAIWLSTPFGANAAAKFARQMDAITVGNSFLAEWYSQYCDSVFVIPDPIDTNRYRPITHEAKSEKEFVIGWIGTASNFGELYRIEEALKKFVTRYKDTKIRIVSNKVPRFSCLPPSNVEFVRWSADTEVKDICSFSVGIMPLADSEWARGKNSNKMLCYMACGLPVVVSPTGNNIDILNMADIGYGVKSNDNWVEALESVRNNDFLAQNFGNNGRALVEQEFSREILAKKLSAVFKEFI